jgi:Leucine Rich Repeat (LRR) protein
VVLVERELQESDAPSGDSERSPVVGVSRRFTVAHMMVAVGLFAVLFSFLQFLGAAPVMYVPCVLFCVAVLLGQMFLYQGREPRRASCVVGSRLLPVFVIVPVVVPQLPWALGRLGAGWLGFVDFTFVSFLVVLSAVLLAILGFVLGYTLGTISAGVFLLLDRQRDVGQISESTLEASDGNGGRSEAQPLGPTGKGWLDWVAWSPLGWSWRGRDHVWRNSLLWTVLFALPLLLLFPIGLRILGGNASLAIVAVVPPLFGLAMAGLFFAGWRASLFFAVAGVAAALYPMMLVRQIWPMGILLVDDIPWPGAEVPVGIALAILVAGAYGWARRRHSDRRPGELRQGLLRRPFGTICTVTGMLLALLTLFLYRVADAPRNRVIHAVRQGDGWVRSEGRSMSLVKTIGLTREQVSDQMLADVVCLQEASELGCFEGTISVAGMASIARLKNLTVLGMIECQIDEKAAEGLSGLKGLQTLFLRDSNITDADLATVGEFTKLQTLILKGTAVTGPGLQHLKNLNELDLLDLTGCPLGDAGFAHLPPLENLTVLELAGTDLSGDSLAQLDDYPDLETLDLSGCLLGDTGLAQLPTLKRLKILRLADTGLTDKSLGHLKSLPKLESLDLSGNSVTDAALPLLRELPLVEVELGETSVTPKAWAELEPYWRQQRPQDFADR